MLCHTGNAGINKCPSGKIKVCSRNRISTEQVTNYYKNNLIPFSMILVLTFGVLSIRAVINEFFFSFCFPETMFWMYSK